MPTHILTLLAKKEVAKETIVYIFSKPDQFTFTPGQFGGFTLLSLLKTNPAASTRRFSLLSTPDDPHIAIATRLQLSDYKRVLNALPLGGEIKFTGPSGIFTLHESATIPAVFIAGGIGITPFYSMIRHVLSQKISKTFKTPKNIYLFYGNQTQESSAFLEEFFLLQKTHPHFVFVPVMAIHSPTWQGETGFITDHIIKKYVNHLSNPIFYICGSPMMVKALHETLSDMEIPDERIKLEDFPGY
jgi:ferredoxin-NADP reductase